MRQRLDYAGLLWIHIHHELETWNDWCNEFENAGLPIPEDVQNGLDGVEEAWEALEAYFEWASQEMRKANIHMENYILARNFMENLFGTDLVCVTYC